MTLSPDFAAVTQNRSVDAVLWLLLLLIGVFVPNFGTKIFLFMFCLDR